jgi:hypothetical protein
VYEGAESEDSDMYMPEDGPESEDEEDTTRTMIAHEEEESQDSHAKTKRQYKPGRHSIIALRQTAGSSFTSSTSSDSKRKENASRYCS